jgi:hypothetical protein
MVRARHITAKAQTTNNNNNGLIRGMRALDALNHRLGMPPRVKFRRSLPSMALQNSSRITKTEGNIPAGQHSQ